MSSTTAPRFKVIIVGAGIAGLCASIGLAQQGHTVTILESAQELTPIGIGLHIPPNATLVLKHFGLLEKLAKDAIQPTSFIFRRWAGDSVLARFPAWRPTQDGSLPYWSMRRSDYQRHLYEAAIEAGCHIRLGARVETMNDDHPSVTLASGEMVHADLVVVADGIKSKLRKLVIPEEQVSINPNPLSSYRAYVHKSDLLSDPIIAPLFQERETATNIWLGPSRHVILYPCGSDLFTLGATHPSKEVEATIMEWTHAADPQTAQADFPSSSWDPAVTAILSHAQDIKQWRLAEVPRLPHWTSKSAKAVLIGDAAHAMLQFLAQGAAMATEDAAALAECVGRAKTAADVPAVLRAFERSRKWRCEIVQAQARRNGDVIHMPDGEEQENRDAEMAGRAQTGTGVWRADTGPMMDGEFREYLYGHDVVEHTRKVLDGMGL